MDSIKGILDGDSLQVAGCYFQAQREDEVDLPDWRSQEILLENLLVLDGVWRGVELPKDVLSVT